MQAWRPTVWLRLASCGVLSCGLVSCGGSITESSGARSGEVTAESSTNNVEPAVAAGSTPSSSPVPTAKPVYVPLLSTAQPGWQSAPQGIVLGSELVQAKNTTPELFAAGGLPLAHEALTLFPQTDERQKTLTGLIVVFDTPAALESAVSGWPQPVIARDGLHCARIWLGSDSLRARVVDPRPVELFAECPTPQPEQAALVVEEYWSIDHLLPGEGSRWGFEGDQPLLGMTIETLTQRWGTRLSPATVPSNVPDSWVLHLPPLHTGNTATEITFALHEGQIRLVRANVSQGKTEGLDRTSTVERITQKWGKLEENEPHVRLSTTGDPHIEVSLLGSAVRSITQRDPQLCPLETNAQRESAIQTLGDRWIEQQEAKNLADSLPPSESPIYVNRGYRLGRTPGALVHERTVNNGCLDHYWSLTRERTECGVENIAASRWGTDCCAPMQCEATPKMWMLRMFNAIQGKDVRLLKKLLSPTGSLRIHSIYGSKEIEITRAGASLASIASFPDWAPQSDGTECTLQPEGRTLCVAGPKAYRMHFYWSGSDEQMYLDEIRVDTH